MGSGQPDLPYSPGSGLGWLEGPSPPRDRCHCGVTTLQICHRCHYCLPPPPWPGLQATTLSYLSSSPAPSSPDCSFFSVASQREAKPGPGDPAVKPEAAGLPQQGGAAQAAPLHGHRGRAAGGQAEQRGGPTRRASCCLFTPFSMPLTVVGFPSRRRTGWRWRGLSPAP